MPYYTPTTHSSLLKGRKPLHMQNYSLRWQLKVELACEPKRATYQNREKAIIAKHTTFTFTGSIKSREDIETAILDKNYKSVSYNPKIDYILIGDRPGTAYYRHIKRR